MQSVKDRNLFTALMRQCWTSRRHQKTSGYTAAMFISIGPMPFLAPTFDNADLLLAPVSGYLVTESGLKFRLRDTSLAYIRWFSSFG